MNETQYYEIARTCDEVLRQPGTPLEVLALPWLHVLSQHPANLERYASLVAANREAPPVRRRVRGVVRSLVIGGGRAALAVARGSRPAARRLRSAWLVDRQHMQASRFDVLLVGWLVNSQHLARSDDFYYGRLQEALAEHGLSSLLVLQNGTGVGTETLADRARDSTWPRLLLPSVLDPARELRFSRRSLAAAVDLWRAAARSTSTLRSRVIRTAGDRLAAGEALDGLRVHTQVAELCRAYGPAMVLTLYEGHAWERCAWVAARSVNPSICCVGYQHAIVWEHSHALKRSLGGARDPDLIVTAGAVNQRRLDASPGLRGTAVEVLGTHRYNDRFAGLRTPSRSPAVLVLPEGLPSECRMLFNFAIQCARRVPEVQFIFRTHPVLPFESIRGTLDGLDAVQNVEISQYPQIEDDFARAGHVLYRGSSAVVYAVQAGLRPYYVDCAGEIPFDPLYEITSWRTTIDSPDGFVRAYCAAVEERPAHAAGQWETARAFCAAYAEPVTSASVEALVRRVIRAPSAAAAGAG